MIHPNEVQSQSEKRNIKNNEPSENEYNINLAHQLVNYLKKFCERIALSQDEFINKLLKMHLEEIESGINSKNYELMSCYYNFSGLLEGKVSIRNKIIDEEINQKIIIKINGEINNTIVEVCKIIKKISPQIFIEHSIEYQLKAIIDNIKKGYHTFLEEFCNFSEIITHLKKLNLKLNRITQHRQ